MVKKQLFYLFYIFFAVLLYSYVLNEKNILPNLTNSQEPELLEKKYQEPEPEPLKN